ncbi:hypothetical protein TNCV_2125281 [Trichonephila clavipes]|nr:hypothetical protein TNCV_2125281 [Trichonephila clavipes]
MEEMVEELQEQRNQLRQDTKRNIQKIQAENKRTYDRKRKRAPRYQKGDLVAIQRTHNSDQILIFELVLELIERCSLIQSIDGVVPDTALDAPPVTIGNELIPIVHCLEHVRGPRPEGQVCFTARSLASSSTQRCRSNNYCPCRRIILCVEYLPGVVSSCHLQPTTLQNSCFSEAAQTNTSGTVNGCF